MSLFVDVHLLAHVLEFVTDFDSRFAASLVSRAFREACNFDNFARAECLRPGFIRDACRSKTLLAAKYDIHRAPHRANDYMLIAAKFGRLDIVKLAHPLAHDDASAAHEAFRSGNLDCAKFFLSLPITYDCSHIAFAVESGNVELFEAVFAKYHPRECHGSLIDSAYESGSEAMIARIESLPAKRHDGTDAVHTWTSRFAGACAGGHRELVARLLSDEAAIAADAAPFADAFISACKHGHRDIADDILRHAGAAGLVGLEVGYFADVAGICGHQWAIDKVVELDNAHRILDDDDGIGALSGACANGTTRGFEIARDLIARGTDINDDVARNMFCSHIDRDGPLDVDFVRFVLARIDQPWVWYAALTSAVRRGQCEAADGEHGLFGLVHAEFVARHGRDLNVPELNCLLYSAACGCNTWAVDWLVRQGANDFARGLRGACRSFCSRRADMCERFIELGVACQSLTAEDIGAAMCQAWVARNEPAIEVLLAHGATRIGDTVGVISDRALHDKYSEVLLADHAYPEVEE